MDEIEKSSDILSEKTINEVSNKVFDLASHITKNKKYLLLSGFYTMSSLILLYSIVISSQEIMESKLIDFIISMYFNDKFITVSSLVGFAGALTLLIGHIVSENEEKNSGKEGKLLSGLVFFHNKLLTISSLIIIVVFTKAYYHSVKYTELIILSLLIILFYALWMHFHNHLNDVYNWNMIESKDYRIFFNIFFGASAFNLLFFVYIYSLKYVETLVFNLLNLWLLFLATTVIASFKYPRTKRIVIKYSDNREEYAHLVRIEDGFARIIIKDCVSKQINISDINEINYDIKYIENFTKLETNKQTS